jgi:hypothetical protein
MLMLDSALILLAAAVSWLFGYRVGKWRGEMDEYIHTAECSLAAARQASRRTPEQIPDVSMMNFPYHSEATSTKLREREHGSFVAAKRCHAYKGLEYHYCGRFPGRMFPLAPDMDTGTTIRESRRMPPPPPTPDIQISTTIREGGRG